MAETTELTNPGLRRAWQLSYVDPGASLALARSLRDQGGACGAEAQLLVALGEARLAPTVQAQLAVDTARRLCLELAESGDGEPANRKTQAERGLRLCDELQAVLLRRQGDADGSARLHALLDAHHGAPRTPCTASSRTTHVPSPASCWARWMLRCGSEF